MSSNGVIVVSNGLKGIYNMGNTCYINTVFQCLGYCNVFISYVLGARYKQYLRNSDTSILENLRDLFTNIWINNETSRPNELLKVIYNKCNKIINIFEQNDINEFMAIIIEKISAEVNRPYESLNILYKDTIYDRQKRKMDDSWAMTHKKEYSDLTDMFFGQMISQIICGNCGKIHHNYEVVMNLMLSVKGCENIEECFDKHFSEEYINNSDNSKENKWKCDECNKCVKSKKTIKLWRIPKILIVSLKRFNSSLKKITTSVSVPFQLDISKYMIGPSSCNTYNLKSIAFHMGSFQYGHYFAACKNSGKWYIFDDEVVREIENIDDAISSGYVYFYEIDDAGLGGRSIFSMS